MARENELQKKLLNDIWKWCLLFWREQSMARLQRRKENGEASTVPLFDPINILFSLAFLSTSSADWLLIICFSDIIHM